MTTPRNPDPGSVTANEPTQSSEVAHGLHQAHLVVEMNERVNVAGAASLDRSGTNDSKDQPFRFFSLARELRNRVYRYLLPAFVRTKHDPPELCLWHPDTLTMAPIYSNALVLVSRQFKSEYVEEAFTEARAAFRIPMEEGRFDLDNRRPEIPRNVTSILKHLEVRIDLLYGSFKQWPKSTLHCSSLDYMRMLIM